MLTRKLMTLAVIPFLIAACSNAEESPTSDSAAGVAATTPTDAGAVRQAIEASNTKFVDAVKKGDSLTVADNYADDAVVMMNNSESMRGRDAIRKGLLDLVTQMPAKDFTLKTEDVVVGGDLAVETGTYDMTLQPKGGKEVKEKGRYVTAWKRQADGSWKIVRDISNSETSPKT